MTKVAVFGTNGQLGQTLQNQAHNQIESYEFFNKEEADITNKDQIHKIFSNNSFKYCINCAAYTNVDGAEQNKDIAFKINSEGVKNLSEICKKHNVILIHISTDYVFDGKATLPYKTTDKPNPINQYGKSKLDGECHVQKQLEKYYIIRTSWLYSPYGKNFVKTILSKVKEDIDLKITTEEEGTPTSCIDLSNFIISIIEKGDVPYGIYNFSAKGSTNWYLFALEVARNFFPNRVSKISPTSRYKTLANRPKYSVLNLEKTELIYQNLKDWKESLKTAIQEIKKDAVL